MYTDAYKIYLSNNNLIYLFIYLLKTLQSRRILQGLIKQREIDFSCDISTGQYQSSSVDLFFFFSGLVGYPFNLQSDIKKCILLISAQ